MFSDNLTQKIAEAAKKIMDEELKGGQKKLDKNHNGKLDSEDFKILRKEEMQQEGAVPSTEKVITVKHKTSGKTLKVVANAAEKYKGIGYHPVEKEEKMKKEDVEQIDEIKRGGFTAGWRDEKHFGKGVPTNRPMTDKEKVESQKTKDIQSYLNDLSKDKLKKEEVELEEGIISKTYDPKTKTTTVKGTYGRENSPEAGETNWDKENKMDKSTTTPAKKKGYGARQNYVRSVKESFSGMMAAYKEEGLKALLVTEEPTNDEYTAEVKAAQAKSEGKGKKAEVGKGAVQAVKTEETHTKVEVLDFNDINGVKRSEIDLAEDAVEEAVRVYDVSSSNQGVRPKTPEERNRAAAAVKSARANKPTDRYTAKPVTGAGSVGAGQRQAGKPVSHIAVREEAEEIDERSMTDAEMAKREKIVKSMKKGLSGFKQRYGDRAKNVMYATATKQAMKD